MSPQRSRPLECRASGGLIAVVPGDETKCVMRAGIVRIVFEHLLRGPRGKLPVSGLTGCARDGFEREQRLSPRVGPRRGADVLRHLSKRRTALVPLTARAA